MSASESWRRARSRLDAALAWSAGSDDETDWDENDVSWDESGARYGERDDEAPLRLVRPPRHEFSAVAVTTFDDAQRIADAFRRETPVMVDLQGCGADVERRVIDFCSGLAYARDGALRVVAEHLIMLAPAHVELSGDERRGLAGSGFYNQS
ncbi:MAG TPA: cell division protein SepF [Thermoleophilia bacterium]|nr:cell division protein SepF [Thermoleophilia bacterium]